LNEYWELLLRGKSALIKNAAYAVMCSCLNKYRCTSSWLREPSLPNVQYALLIFIKLCLFLYSTALLPLLFVVSHICFMVKQTTDLQFLLLWTLSYVCNLLILWSTFTCFFLVQTNCDSFPAR
jgi:hypothetical protein